MPVHCWSRRKLQWTWVTRLSSGGQQTLGAPTGEEEILKEQLILDQRSPACDSGKRPAAARCCRIISTSIIDQRSHRQQRPAWTGPAAPLSGCR